MSSSTPSSATLSTPGEAGRVDKVALSRAVARFARAHSGALPLTTRLRALDPDAQMLAAELLNLLVRETVARAAAAARADQSSSSAAAGAVRVGPQHVRTVLASILLDL
jgi:CENP-S associating Centromere protein X